MFDMFIDSDDEMIKAGALLQSHAATTAAIDKCLTIIICLLGLLAEVSTNPTHGPKIGRRKNKNRQRMEGHLLVVADYFTDDPTHDRKLFGGVFG